MADPQQPSWLLWQLVDSVFPSGGFSHSLGIESARQQGFVADETELYQAAEAVLYQQAYTSVPLLAATHRTPADFVATDHLADALLTNHTARNASIAQGRSLIRAATAAFDEAFEDAPLKDAPLKEVDHAIRTEDAHGHLAPLFGVLCRALDIDLVASANLYLYQTLRSLMSASVRLNILGPLRAQALTHQLSDAGREAAQIGLQTPLEDAADPLALLNVLQGNQDRLYSRIFQS